MRKEKKVISSLLICSILLSIFMPLISRAEDIDSGIVFTLSSDATELVEGSQITVSMYIQLDSGKQVDTFSGEIIYDTSVLEFDLEDEFITSSETKFSTPTYVDNDGTMLLDSTRSDANSAKSGLMYTMKFNVLKTVSSTEISLGEPINCAYLGEDSYSAGYTLRVPDVKETYTITYNQNTTDTVNNMPSIGTKVEGTDYNIATAPVRTGYIFTGWNTQANGTGTAYAAGSVYSTDASLELYAQWEAITTTLTVDPNGGVWEGSSTTQTFTQAYGTTKEIPNPTTTPYGYTVRFNATSNGGTTNNLQTIQTTTFANWDFVGGGTFQGTTYTFSDTTATLTANYTADSITLPDATKTGATFKGWYTAQTGGTKVGGVGDSYVPTEATTLFAQWEDIDYTLTVNPNGGEWNGSTANGTIEGIYNSTTTIADPTAPNGYTVTLDDEGTITTETQTTAFAGWTVVTGSGTLSGSDYTFGAENGEISATYTPNSIELPELTKTGYTFDGWYTEATEGTKVGNAGEEYTPTSDITLYAHWTANTYEITFDANEGSVETTTKEVTYGETYGTLPEPTKPGYDFDGWYDQNGNKIEETDIVNITEDTTLTAKWLGAEYTVTLDPDGGEVSSETITVTNEEPYGELPTPTKEGYIFKGWYDKDGNKIESTTIVNLTEDTTLTAQWEAIKTTLTINPNEGTWEGSTEQQTFTQDYNTTKEIADPIAPNGYVVSFDSNEGDSNPTSLTQPVEFENWTLTDGGIFEGTTYTFDLTSEILTANYTRGNITLPEVTKIGATFKGWYTQATEGTKVGEIGEEYTPTSDITLYAQWEDINYTLTVDPNGGEWNGSTANGTVQGIYNSTTTIADPTAPNGYIVTFDNEGTITTETQATTFAGWTVVTGSGTINGSDYTFGAENGEISATYTPNSIELPELTKTGYTFDGWYTEATEGTKVGNAGEEYTPTSDITLYAHWTANTYEITFDANEGSVETTTKEVTYGETYGTLPTPTREGYDFDGWYDQNGNKITEDDVVNVTEDTTLTAVWLGAEYTVTLDPNGGEVSPETITVRNEGKYGELPTPTKEGYTFVEWQDENGNKVDSKTTVSLTSDATLTAQWEVIKTTLTINPNEGTWEGNTEQQTFTQDYNTTKEIADPIAPNGYVVSFDSNEGDSNPTSLTQPVEFENWTLTDGGIFEGTTYTFDLTDEVLTANYTRGNITLPEVTKIGATFKGWYTQATEGTKVGEIGEEYTPTSDITLYAQWEDINYTLTVDPNGGEWEGNTANGTIEGIYNSTTTIADPTAPNGYTVTLDDEGTITTETQTTTFAGWTVVTGSGTINGSDYTFGAEDGEISATYTPNSIELPEPTKTGYTLDGWYTEATEGTKVGEAGEEYTPTSDITLYAHWTANIYEITFKPDNGSAETTKEVTYGEEYGTLPEPTKPGYVFDGWYDQNGNKIEETDIVNITEDITVTAQWEGAEYTVTLDPDGGEVSQTTITVKNEEPYGTLPEPTKVGYTFKGWYDQNGDKIEETTIVNITEDITLIAQWEAIKTTLTINPNEGEWEGSTEQQTFTQDYNTTKEIADPTAPNGYVVSFDSNGGDSNPTSITQSIEFENWTLTDGGIFEGTTYTFDLTDEVLTANYTKGTITLPEVTKTGYIFDGWYTEVTEGEKVGEAGEEYTPTSDITLYAQWEGAEYTVTLDPDGGEVSQTTITVKNEEPYGELPVPTKEGYTFVEWQDENGNKIESTTIVNLTSDTTLHAIYEINKYTITFQNDDGTVIDTVTAEYGTKVDYTGTEPVQNNTPAGYESTFAGWKNLDKLDKVTEDTTIKATYTLTPIVYTIKYENGNERENSQNPTTYTIEDGTIQLADLPNQEKLIFKGWYTTNDETGTKVTSIDTSKMENIILYAQWEEDKLYLKSQKYKVGENDIDIYEENDVYLDKIEPETTVEELIDNCETNGTITVIDQEGNILEEDDIVGTNMTIKVTRNDEEITLTAVVMGDLDGNGKVTATDLSALNQTILRLTQLEGAEFKAADLDDNGRITATDLSTENNAILKNITLTYTKP